MNEPKKGERVFVRPLHPCVPLAENAGAQFLEDAGREIVWSRWWWQRHRDGDVQIVKPEAAKPEPVKVAAPVKGDK